MGLSRAEGSDLELDEGGERRKGQEGVSPAHSPLPAVSKQSLQDIRGPGCPKHRPLHRSVLEDATVDFVGSQPLFHPLLHAVAFRESHGLRPRVETVIYKIDFVLRERKARRASVCSCVAHSSPGPPGTGLAWKASHCTPRSESGAPSPPAWPGQALPMPCWGAGLGPGVCWQWHRCMLCIRSSVQPCHELAHLAGPQAPDYDSNLPFSVSQQPPRAGTISHFVLVLKAGPWGTLAASLSGKAREQQACEEPRGK